MWVLIVLGYLVMMVLTARSITMQGKTTSGDRFLAGLVWPIIWGIILWHILDGTAKLTWTWKGRQRVHYGRNHSLRQMGR